MEVPAGGARLLADEPVEAGGLGSGPTPYDLLAAGFGACTAMTLRLYARDKKLALDTIKVKVGHSRTAEGTDLFVRRIELEGGLPAEQPARLIEIAERCPVHTTLDAGAAIETLAGDEPKAEVEQPTQHARDMEQLCGEED